METQAQNKKATSSHAIANQATQKKRNNKFLRRISDNRPETITQRKQQSAITEGTNKPIQTKANNTGLPNNLKSGIENLSGFAMDDVKVHYNSAKPSQFKAYAYTQGTDIHVAPGQERHLPHEAWHVVQQKQGRVTPNRQLKGIHINDNAGLEKEADVMGNKGNDFQTRIVPSQNTKVHQNNFSSLVIQRKLEPDMKTLLELKKPVYQGNNSEACWFLSVLYGLHQAKWIESLFENQIDVNKNNGHFICTKGNETIKINEKRG